MDFNFNLGYALYQEVPDIPGRPEHIIVDLALPDWRRLPVDYNLLDDEAHLCESTLVHGVPPNCVFIDFVNPVYQRDEVVDLIRDNFTR